MSSQTSADGGAGRRRRGTTNSRSAGALEISRLPKPVSLVRNHLLLKSELTGNAASDADKLAGALPRVSST